MRRTYLFRVSALLAATSLTGIPAWPLPALAQQASPPAPQQAGPGGDPPTRVGRLARIVGTVSFHTESETDWRPAVLNYPVTTGDAYWTDQQASAGIEISGNRMEMMDQTELDIAQLDNENFVGTVPQGEVCISLRNVPQGETYAFQTPRGTVQIAAPGHYAIVAGDTQEPTTVTTLDGAAQITDNNLSLQVGANQMASISGDNTFQGSVSQANGPDQCLQDLISAEQPQQAQGGGAPQGQVAAAPAVVQEMTGGGDLSEYGSWQDNSDYGAVWYPSDVGNDWVPYQDGSWSYVAPWGWTWMSAQPWGFAPFHYGRWAYIGNRWGWVPAYRGYAVVARPVYAPALVTFFGAGVGVGIGIGAALAAGRVGWVPLGPREPYYPWYHASPRYVGRVNVTNIRNVRVVENNYRNVVINHTKVVNNVTINNYANHRALTVVNARAMADSRPIRAARENVNHTELAKLRPVVAREPLRPTAQTHGLTPAVARRLDVHVPKGTVPGGRTAPGPKINPGEFHRGARVPLRQVAAGAAHGQPAANSTPAHRGQAHAPGAFATHPGANRGPEANAQQHPGQRGPSRGPAGTNEHPAQPGPNRGSAGANRHPAQPGVNHAPAANEHPNQPGPNHGPAPGQPNRPAAAEHPNQGGAPGPAVAPHHPASPGHLPALRSPGSRPPAEAPHAAPPASHPQGAQRPTPRLETHPAPHRQPAPRPAPARHQQPAPRPESRPVPQPAPRPAPRPEPRPAPRPAPRPEPRPAPRPAPRPELRPEPRPAPRPAPRPEPRPAPRPAPRPEPRPAPRPMPAPHAAPRPAPHPAPHPAPEQRRPPQQ